MRAIYIILEIIGLILISMHVLFKLTGWTDINLLYTSFFVLLVGSFFESIFLRKKIKKLEIEIAKGKSKEA